MARTQCPGPENASECENPGCRHGGCQGRVPVKKEKAKDEQILD